MNGNAKCQSDDSAAAGKLPNNYVWVKPTQIVRIDLRYHGHRYKVVHGCVSSAIAAMRSLGHALLGETEARADFFCSRRGSKRFRAPYIGHPDARASASNENDCANILDPTREDFRSTPVTINVA